jgi:hypothetical protein
MIFVLNRFLIPITLAALTALAFSFLLGPLSSIHAQETPDQIEVGPGEECPEGYDPIGQTTDGGTICQIPVTPDPGDGGNGNGGENEDGIGSLRFPGIGHITLKVPSLSQLVGNLVLLAYFVAGLFFLIQLAIGGISWMNSGGDTKALEAARMRLMNALIGIVIVAASFVIAVIVTTALNINIFSGPISIGD